MPKNSTSKNIYTMESEKYTERLAKYTLFAAIFCIIAALCWFFSSVLVYILTSVVVSLLARPIMKGMQKIAIKGWRLPNWFSAILSLLIIITIFLCLLTMIIPMVGNIAKGLSIGNIENAANNIAIPLQHLNEWLRDTFPSLGYNYRIETVVFNELKSLLDVSVFSSVIGSAASIVSKIGIGIFAVVFISFFFIKDRSLFARMVGALVPDKHEENAKAAITDIGHLLSRYFSGIVLEMFGVGLINFIGLYFIARLGFNASIGIAFITGIMIIIPYVGPLIGGTLGTLLAIIVKYSSAGEIGLNIEFGWFVILVIAIFCFTQLIDNILYQPIIYSNSIKARPLEIFIILLIAGHIAGPMGMIIAIPTYTAIRVIAFRFFGHIKAIQRLQNL